MNKGGNIVAAFSADQVAKLTGLTMNQLAYWDKIGFFCPQYATENRRSPLSRIYSFEDLVGLRTISVLKNGYNVSLHHLKETAEKLSKYTERPWSEIRLAVWNRDITWLEPDTGLPAGVVSGQYVLFELIDVIEDMKKEVLTLRTRNQDEYGKITRKRNVAHNSDVFAGTRIPVRVVRSFAAAGYSVEEILREYPTLTKADIEAAINKNSTSSAA